MNKKTRVRFAYSCFLHYKAAAYKLFTHIEDSGLAGRRGADRDFNYVHACAAYPLSDMTIKIPIE